MKKWMSRVILVALSVATRAWAQGAVEHVAAGDTLFAARDARGALREYELAIAANPVNYDALCKASRSAIDLGEFEPIAAERTALFVRGRAHAQAAATAVPRGVEVMRLPGVLRFIARTFLGGAIFAEASWEQAQRYLEQAVAAEPNRIVHRLDLGLILRDRGNIDGARAQFEWIGRAAVTDINDPHYKQQAATEWRKL